MILKEKGTRYPIPITSLDTSVLYQDGIQFSVVFPRFITMKIYVRMSFHKAYYHFQFCLLFCLLSSIYYKYHLLNDDKVPFLMVRKGLQFKAKDLLFDGSQIYFIWVLFEFEISFAFHRLFTSNPV